MTGHSRLSRVALDRLGPGLTRVQPAGPSRSAPYLAPGQLDHGICSVRFLARPHWPDRSETSRDEALGSLLQRTSQIRLRARRPQHPRFRNFERRWECQDILPVRLSNCQVVRPARLQSGFFPRNEPEGPRQSSCTTSVSGTPKEGFGPRKEQKNCGRTHIPRWVWQCRQSLRGFVQRGLVCALSLPNTSC
jgi:hypothetical protein